MKFICPRFSFILSLLLSLALLSGCYLHRLDVQTQYLSQQSLASFHVGTPDPKLKEPIIGQRLLIQWCLSSADVAEGKGELYLYLKVRWRNHHEEEVVVPVCSRIGTYLYVLANDNYRESGGILTYFAEIRRGDDVLAEWKHPLWTELIKLNN